MSVFDKAKDKLEKTVGRAKEQTGKATDNRSLEAEGKGDQASGSIKEAGHDLQNKAKEAVEDTRRELGGET